MKAVASRRSSDRYRHDIRIRDHVVSADEPRDAGGDNTAPSPQELLAASLASCTAVTMEMYAAHKGWDVGEVEVSAEYTPAERGCPTSFRTILRFPNHLSDEQVERLRAIAAKCPVHRTLDGEVMFTESVERAEAAVPASS
ncbi:MAG TPA: OsmC family protein [Solirubrobacteraceae bacterium]|nr:OsmC family protein [Solirubrobacteraceae bacterium]